MRGQPIDPTTELDTAGTADPSVDTDLKTLFAALTAQKPAAETSKWGAVYKLLAPEPESAQQQNLRLARSNAARMIDQLEEIYTGGTDKYSMAHGRIGGIVASLQALTEQYPQLRTYKTVLRSMAPAFAKAAGDTGNIALAEQIAQMKAFPSEFSTEAEAKLQFNEMRKRFGVAPRKKTADIDALVGQLLGGEQ